MSKLPIKYTEMPQRSTSQGREYSAEHDPLYSEGFLLPTEHPSRQSKT